MRKRIGRAAMSLLLAGAIAVSMPSAGGTVRAVSGGTAAGEAFGVGWPEGEATDEGTGGYAPAERGASGEAAADKSGGAFFGEAAGSGGQGAVPGKGEAPEGLPVDGEGQGEAAGAGEGSGSPEEGSQAGAPVDGEDAGSASGKESPGTNPADGEDADAVPGKEEPGGEPAAGEGAGEVPGKEEPGGEPAAGEGAGEAPGKEESGGEPAAGEGAGEALGKEEPEGEPAAGEGAGEAPGKEGLEETPGEDTGGAPENGEASNDSSADAAVTDGPAAEMPGDGALPVEPSGGDALPMGKMPARDAGGMGVTYETVGDYKHNIYANGQPLLILASENAGYAKLYVDSNGNGIGEAEEEITSFQGNGLMNGTGISYSESMGGYLLRHSSIYGGAKEGTCQYDTHVTLAGASREPDSANPICTVWAIHGGNKEGILTGDTHVAISGGSARYVLGGGRGGEIVGNTSIRVTGGDVVNNIYGGSATGAISGSTGIYIENARVCYVFGGNEDSGKVGGNTELVFADGAIVNGWTYGGGAGREGQARTEVAGSTNITINGGSFFRHVYGGGGWQGATVGSSNITVNAGNLEGVWIYGGGEEMSEVTGKASITVQGGTVGAVCASGAGFSDTAPTVGEADIRLSGGTVGAFWALANERVSIQRDLSVTVSGDSLAGKWLNLGGSGYKDFQTVSVKLKDGKAAGLQIYSKVAGKLAITFENASVDQLRLAEGILKSAEEATLSYIGCGQEGGWGRVEGYNRFIPGENPLLWGSYLNKNRFTCMTFQDSYVDYFDDSTTSGDDGPAACAQKLVVDGGALRLTGSMLTYMPPTQLLNNPLLIRSSENQQGIHFNENPQGQARIQGMDTDGTGPVGSYSLAETPEVGPEDIFLPASDGYAVIYESSLRGGSSGVIWRGRSWKTDLTEKLCRCQVISSSLKETVFPLPESGGATVTLEDVREGSAAGSQNCPIFTHKDTAAVFTYILLGEGTTAPGAALEGNSLTVEGPGTAHVEIRQELSGKTCVYDAFVDFIRVPEKNCYIFAQGMAEDISFALEGAAFNEEYSYIWNRSDQSQNGYVEWNMYTKTLEDNALRFDFSREYYNGLPVGEYSFQAIAYFRSGSGRERLFGHEFTIKIVLPTEVENPDIRLSESRFHYDGTAKEPPVVVMDGDTVIPETEYTVTYRDNVDVGTASVIVTNRPGGLYIVNGSSTFDIVNEYQPQKGRDYLASTSGDGWTQEDFVVSAGEGHLLSLGNTITDDWVGELRRTEETGQGSLTFYVKDKETGRISLAATEAYRIDRTAPETFDIRFDGASVRRIPTAVSFSRFSRKEIAVSIMAADSLSGVGSIAYYQSGSILTEAQLRDVEDWIPGDRFIIAPGDGRRLVVYVRAVDLAGNAVYYASEGVKFDLTPPAVSGVRPGATYYTTRTAAVTDSNPGPITLNGEAAPDRLTLPGNREAAYVIKAVDLAGNMTVVTVSMKPISALAESIEGLTEENVTSEDAQALDLIRAVEADCDSATREEKEELQEILDACQRLQARIDGAQDGLADVEGTVEGISKDTVRLTDQENLEKAEKELESLLEEYGGNYTEAEKLSIEADLNRIAEALESIGKVLETADAIAKLPDPEDVSPDDHAADSAAAQVQHALESLTEHEKSMVDTEKLEQVLAALADYRILEGDGSQWIQETEGGITFRVNGAVEKFTALLVDGEEVDPEQYTVKSGSTILTLKQSYLDTLPVGTHSLTVLYLNGSASGEFEIQTKDGGTAEPDDGTEGDRPGGEGPGTDRPGGDEPGTDEPGGDRPGGDEPGGDGPGTDRPGGDRPGADSGSGTGSGDGGRKENGDGKMLSPATGQ